MVESAGSLLNSVAEIIGERLTVSSGPTFVGLFENHQLPVSPHLLIFTTPPYSSSKDVICESVVSLGSLPLLLLLFSTAVFAESPERAIYRLQPYRRWWKATKPSGGFIIDLRTNANVTTGGITPG